MFHIDSNDPKFIGAVLMGVAAIHALVVLRHWSRPESTILTLFSPKGGCTTAIVNELAHARREVLVQAYSFSCPDIVQALIAAGKRRVRVIVLLDRSNEVETYSALREVQEQGLEVWIDACHAIAHNKVMVLDRKTVITGSFNFTRQAEHENAENLLILRHQRELAERYRINFFHHREHCHIPGQAPGSAPLATTRNDRGHPAAAHSGMHRSPE